MKIGELLIKEGLISNDDLNVALSEQSKTNDRIGDILLKMGFVDSEKLAPILARYFKISYVELKNTYKDIESQIIDCVPHEIAQRFSVMPLSVKDNTLTVAM